MHNRRWRICWQWHYRSSWGAAFAPRTGVGVSGDTKTVVHIVILDGNGTGKDGRVRSAARRGGSDAVGVKRVQVKGSAAAL